MKLYGTLKLKPGTGPGPRSHWLMHAEPHVLMRVRRILPRVGQHAGAITVHDSPEVCVDLRWITDRWPLLMSDADRAHLHARAENDIARVASFDNVLVGTIPTRPLMTAIALRTYQQQAVELTARAGGLLVGDELGTGKTAIGIGLISLPEARPAAVVTLTHLPEQWAREIKRFIPGTRVHVVKHGSSHDVLPLRGGKDQPFRLPQTAGERDRWPDVFVLSYSKLAGWADALSKVVQTVVFDEAHELRTGTASNKGASAKVLAENARYRLGLTGTPVFNYGDDMWRILDILRPDSLGTMEEFRREWCADEGRVRTPQIFGSYLRTTGLYIRRTRAEVGREIPPLTVETIYVTADPAALDEVQNLAAALARSILNRSAANMFQASGELDWRLRQATGIAKAPEVAAFVRLLVEQGEPVLLYGWHRAVYDLWSAAFDAAGIKYKLYTGEETLNQKAEAVRAFVADEAQVLIMSVRAGAGIDGLQHSRCGVVVNGELDWSPEVHKQGIGRLHRDGQIKPIIAYYLLTNHGSDPVILDVLGVKKQQSLGISDPTNSELAAGADPDRIRKLAESYLASITPAVESV